MAGAYGRLRSGVIFALALLAVDASRARATQVRTFVRNYATHHVMAFVLTRENTVFPGADPGVEAARGASFELRDGGQFEVEIVKTKFPFPAPACSKDIIVRMPWSDSDTAAGRADVERKRALYAKLDSLRRGRIDQVPVSIDLSPYVKERSAGGLELTACNVFFRIGHGE
jgi:hypothetical protein